MPKLKASLNHWILKIFSARTVALVINSLIAVRSYSTKNSCFLAVPHPYSKAVSQHLFLKGICHTLGGTSLCLHTLVIHLKTLAWSYQVLLMTMVAQMLLELSAEMARITTKYWKVKTEAEILHPCWTTISESFKAAAPLQQTLLAISALGRMPGKSCRYN